MNPAVASEHIVTVTMANAKEMLIDESMQRPVLIDFWADWCAPCKTLMPMLEKLANEYGGQFLLAKVDCDREQRVAAQFGVRSLPTVVLMKDGQPVDHFVGAQTESEVRKMLENYLPKPWDLLLMQAREQIQAGDFGAALTLLRRAWEDSRKRGDIGIELAAVLVQLNRLDEAQEILRIARSTGARSYSASSLRFTREVATLDRAKLGRIVAVDAFGPGERNASMEGLFFYGVHAIEMVDAIVGPGVRRVAACASEDRDRVELEYADGRTAHIRLERKGAYDFGATVHGETGIVQFS